MPKLSGICMMMTVLSLTPVGAEKIVKSSDHNTSYLVWE
jgi:hypothetical protein